MGLSVSFSYLLSLSLSLSCLLVCPHPLAPLFVPVIVSLAHLLSVHLSLLVCSLPCLSLPRSLLSISVSLWSSWLSLSVSLLLLYCLSFHLPLSSTLWAVPFVQSRCVLTRCRPCQLLPPLSTSTCSVCLWPPGRLDALSGVESLKPVGQLGNWAHRKQSSMLRMLVERLATAASCNPRTLPLLTKAARGGCWGEPRDHAYDSSSGLAEGQSQRASGMTQDVLCSMLAPGAKSYQGKGMYTDGFRGLGTGSVTTRTGEFQGSHAPILTTTIKGGKKPGF